MYVLLYTDGFEDTIIGDPEADQALAEFDFLADENKSDISDIDVQSKEPVKDQGTVSS